MAGRKHRAGQVGVMEMPDKSGLDLGFALNRKVLPRSLVEAGETSA